MKPKTIVDETVKALAKRGQKLSLLELKQAAEYVKEVLRGLRSSK